VLRTLLKRHGLLEDGALRPEGPQNRSFPDRSWSLDAAGV
jgi:hypothetical protein